MKHKTALGRTIDMSALISKNEKVRAVGNMGVNARGDEIDSLGRIVVSATQRVNNSYNKTVGNKSAQVINRNKEPSKNLLQHRALQSAPDTSPRGMSNNLNTNKVQNQNLDEELSDYEKDLKNSFEEDDEIIEKIKGKNGKTSV